MRRPGGGRVFGCLCLYFTGAVKGRSGFPDGGGPFWEGLFWLGILPLYPFRLWRGKLALELLAGSFRRRVARLSLWPGCPKGPPLGRRWNARV